MSGRPYKISLNLVEPSYIQKTLLLSSVDRKFFKAIQRHKVFLESLWTEGYLKIFYLGKAFQAFCTERRTFKGSYMDKQKKTDGVSVDFYQFFALFNIKDLYKRSLRGIL